MSTCNLCRAPIQWAMTELGKRMPIDVEPADDGNIYFLDSQPPTVHVLRRGERTDRPKYHSHIETCPKRQQPRKRTPPPQTEPML